MLYNTDIYLIARETHTVFPFYNGYQVLGWYTFLQNSNEALADYQTRSKYSNETLREFLNITIPCITEEINKPTYSNITGMDSIWTNCFKNTCTTGLEENFEALINLSMVGIGWIALFLATIFTRRVSFHKEKFYGRPGIVVPVNMLDNYENRFGYSAAMALSGSACLAVILGNNQYVIGTENNNNLSSVPAYVKVFVKVLLTFLVSSMAIPFFILQNAKNRILGSVFGLLLAILWIILRLFKTTVLALACNEKYKYENIEATKYFTGLAELPQMICLLFLAGKFIYILYKTAMHRMKTKGIMAMLQNHDDTNWRNEFVYKYVQKIINFKKEDEEDEKDGDDDDKEFKEKLKIKLKEKGYSHNPDFSYSSRILMGSAVSCSVVYTLSIAIGLMGYIIFIHDYEELLGAAFLTFLQDELDISRETIDNYSRCVVISWWVGLALAIAMFIFSMVNSFTWYRKHVIMLRKGDRSFLPNSVIKGSVEPPSLMIASMKFAGFQVAYATWGFLISYLLMFLIVVILATQIFLPIHTKELSIVLQLIINAWPSIVFALMMMIIQRIAASVFFLVDKETLAVDNRRAFHVYSYFMFFYNIFLGIASCLLRIGYGVILGVLFLQRLQKSALPASYAKRDPGFLAYVGYILLENQHANPVLQCFVQLLIEHHKEETSYRKLKREINKTMLIEEDGSTVGDDEEDWQARNREYMKVRMRNKWHLYKMLIQNPSLRKYRAKPKKIEEKSLKGALQNFFNVAAIEIVKHATPDVESHGQNNLLIDEMKSKVVVCEDIDKEEENALPGKVSIHEDENEGIPLISFAETKPSYQANGISPVKNIPDTTSITEEDNRDNDVFVDTASNSNEDNTDISVKGNNKSETSSVSDHHDNVNDSNEVARNKSEILDEDDVVESSTTEKERMPSISSYDDIPESLGIELTHTDSSTSLIKHEEEPHKHSDVFEPTDSKQTTVPPGDVLFVITGSQSSNTAVNKDFVKPSTEENTAEAPSKSQEPYVNTEDIESSC